MRRCSKAGTHASSIVNRPLHTTREVYIKTKHPIRRKTSGRHKARCVAVRLLMPPVENRTYHFHGIRLSTCGRSPCSTKRSFPFHQLPRRSPADSLRVRWLPLVQSFRRLGAFAISPHPGVRGFPAFRLLCPIRLPMKALAFHTALAFLLPPALTSFKGSPVFPQYDFKRDDVGGAFSLPPPLFAAPEIVRRVASGLPAMSL